MTKIYTMEIRDLTNEARELNAQAIKVNTFEVEAKRRIEVMAKNHISAIASYLNHQLDEVVKFTTNFHAECYDMDERIGVRIEKRGEDVIYVLIIKPFCYSNTTSFIINSPKYWLYEDFSVIEKFPFHAETLIKNWLKLKKQLSYNIKVKIESLQKENKEKQDELQRRLSLYENFEL